jgi:hypothetical protein
VKYELAAHRALVLAATVYFLFFQLEAASAAVVGRLGILPAAVGTDFEAHCISPTLKKL